MKLNKSKKIRNMKPRKNKIIWKVIDDDERSMFDINQTRMLSQNSEDGIEVANAVASSVTR